MHTLDEHPSLLTVHFSRLDMLTPISHFEAARLRKSRLIPKFTHYVRLTEQEYASANVDCQYVYRMSWPSMSN